MPQGRFIDITRLRLLEPHLATPGTLLVQRREGGAPPRLAIGRLESAKHNWHMDLDGAHAFKVEPSAIGDAVRLAIGSWRLVVDPASSMEKQSGMPSPGDAFISGGVPGFIARFDYTAAYVALSGGVLPEPSWLTSYVGFRSWKIVTDEFEADEPVVLFEHDGRTSILDAV